MEVKPYALAKALGCDPSNIFHLLKKNPPRLVRNSGGMIDLHNPTNREFIRDRNFTIAEIEEKCARHIRSVEKKKNDAKLNRESSARRKSVYKSRTTALAELENMRKNYEFEQRVLIEAIRETIETMYGEDEAKVVQSEIGKRVKQAMEIQQR